MEIAPPQCGAEFGVEHVVRLNVSEEDEKGMREEVEERRRQAKMAKVGHRIRITIDTIPYA